MKLGLSNRACGADFSGIFPRYLSRGSAFEEGLGKGMMPSMEPACPREESRMRAKKMGCINDGLHLE